MMDRGTFEAGAAQSIITPPLEVMMAGWTLRSAGHNKALYVHDDLWVKALVMRQGNDACAIISADLAGVDAVATERIRQGVAARIGLTEEAVMVCATHTHSGPVVCPVAIACGRETMKEHIIKDGAFKSFGKTTEVSAFAMYAGETDIAWRESFIARAVDTATEAWQLLLPAGIAFSETQISGVGSSRRVLLSDGNWGDPRSQKAPGVQEVSRTDFDRHVRTMSLCREEDHAPLAAVINYGSHPWVFNGTGLSAEIAGAACRKVADAWGTTESPDPVVLFTAGPQGDVTLIWNIDVDNVWKVLPEEDPEESLKRREHEFGKEFDRLGMRLANGVMKGIGAVQDWDFSPKLKVRRQEIALPLKEGYQPVDELLLAEWQKTDPNSHITEIQLFQVGDSAILSMPGEPFSSLGAAVRDGSPFRNLMIVALGNDSGAINYIASREDCEPGGYEIGASPLSANAGSVLVELAGAFLCRIFQEDTDCLRGGKKPSTCTASEEE